MTPTLLEKAKRFKELHERDQIFVMPNAWNAGSAKILAAQGFSAIATTSGGVNYFRGRQDYVYEIPAQEMLEEYRLIAEAVDLPVSGDLENGYGEDPAAVADTIRQSAACGMVGGSIEDWTGDPDRPLDETGFAVERIAAARGAADGCGFPYTLTGRCEIYSFDLPDRLNEAVRRANLYADAGADCIFVPDQIPALVKFGFFFVVVENGVVFVPGLNDPDDLRRLVREVDAPISVVAGLGEVVAGKGDPQLSVAQLADIGVRRISTGGSLARACLGLLERAARELAEEGTFTYTRDAIPDPEINEFFG